jgi:hypothetical protein
MKLYFDTVSYEMLELLKQLMGIAELEPFRLVGGTALALQFGHRKSVDIDLFAGGIVDTSGLAKVIASHFGDSFELISQNRNGFAGQINQIKIDIVDWKVPFTEEPLLVDGIRMANAPDIFASKCDAILDRKAEKDFVDIACIAASFDLKQLFTVLKTRYSFITTGAITAFLLRSDLIIRDSSIEYRKGFTFDALAQDLQKRIIEYEQSLKSLKEKETENRHQRIQELINQKRNKPS